MTSPALAMMRLLPLMLRAFDALAALGRYLSSDKKRCLSPCDDLGEYYDSDDTVEVEVLHRENGNQVGDTARLHCAQPGVFTLDADLGTHVVCACYVPACHVST